MTAVPPMTTPAEGSGPARTRRSFLAGTAVAAAGAVLGAAAWRAPSPRNADEPSPSRWPLGLCRGPDDAALARAAGAAFLEVSCRRWLVPDRDDTAFARSRETLRTAALPVRAANSFLPASLPCFGAAADPTRLLTWTETTFRRASAAGIGVVTFGSGGSRRLPEGVDRADAELRFVALLARMADRAEAHGVLLCVEPLQRTETNFINRVEEARRLVGAVDHPNLGITADLFHMMREDEGPESIRAAGPLIRHVHVAEKRARTAPGVDGDDLRPCLRALADIGYAGRISIECRWKSLATELPRALETLREQTPAASPGAAP